MENVLIASGEKAAGEASDRGDLILLIDALRATTTIVTALGEGIREVRPVCEVESCVGELTAGERNGAKLPGMDLDNSPRSFLGGRYSGKSLVLTTTNGTRCMKAAARSPNALVLLAAMVNLNAAARDARRLANYYGKNISIIASGRLNEEAVEDDLIARLLQIALVENREIPVTDISDNEHLGIFLNGGSGKNLISLGLEEDILFCAKQDSYNLTPVFIDGVCRPLCGSEPPLIGYGG